MSEMPTAPDCPACTEYLLTCGNLMRALTYVAEQADRAVQDVLTGYFIVFHDLDHPPDPMEGLRRLVERGRS
jgi:hypothetical protein